MKEIFFEFILQIFLRLRLEDISHIGEIVGKTIWTFVPSRKKRAITSIEKHLNVPRDKAISIARDNLLNTGKSFVEIFYNPKVDYRFLKDYVEIKDNHILEDIKNSKRPVVAVTAHLGAWELLSGVMAVLFSDRITQIIIREPDDRVIRNIVKRLREKYRHEIIKRDNSAPQIIRGLRRGGISAFLVDHNCGRRKAVFLPFLGEVAAVNFGPALIAVRTRALVFPIFLVRNGKGRYILWPKRPLDTLELKGDLKSKVKKVCEFYTKEVEHMVHKYPAQWYWIHNRWRTKPKESLKKSEIP